MQGFLSISLQWSRYNIELSQLENSEIVLRIYTCLHILERPVQFLDCSRYLLLSNCSLLWIYFLLFYFSTAYSVVYLQGFVFFFLFLFFIASVYVHVPTACTLLSLTSRAQIIYSFPSFVSSFICMTLLLTPKFNLVCYSDPPCQVLRFYFSLFPLHLIFCYLSLPTSSFSTFLSLEVKSILLLTQKGCIWNG